jgi:hypothetical protein
MKKILIFLMLAVFSTAGMAAETKRGIIKEGYTSLSKPMAFTAADSIAGNGGFHIVTSDSLVVLVTNLQKYLQYQTITTTMGYHSGAHNVTVSAWGKATSTDSWHDIGTPVTWDATSENPVIITGTTAKNFNYLRISYVASGATQNVHITALEVKTANVFPYAAMSITGRLTGTGGVTITGAVSNINAASNYATNINTGTSDGALTLGGGSGTVAVNGTGWAITTAGVATLGTVNGLTIANGVGRLVTTSTAATDSTAAGAKLSAVDQYVTVTSGGATRTITLPVAASTTVGLTIEGYVGSNGFDLRVAGAQALTVKINDVTGSAAKGVEAAIPATTKFKVVCVSATEWNLTAVDELGAVITAIVPSTIQKR